MFADLLSPASLPLLEHLEVRVLDVGKKLNGLPTREMIHACSPIPAMEPLNDEPVSAAGWDMEALNAEEAREWAGFTYTFQSIVESRGASCLSFSVIGEPDVMRQKTLLADVRKFTLHEWREHVAGCNGP